MVECTTRHLSALAEAALLSAMTETSPSRSSFNPPEFPIVYVLPNWFCTRRMSSLNQGERAHIDFLLEMIEKLSVI
jgi:hypothetical protein